MRCDNCDRAVLKTYRRNTDGQLICERQRCWMAFAIGQAKACGEVPYAVRESTVTMETDQVEIETVIE